jgi:hypothetical protein
MSRLLLGRRQSCLVNLGKIGLRVECSNPVGYKPRCSAPQFWARKPEICELQFAIMEFWVATASL